MISSVERSERAFKTLRVATDRLSLRLQAYAAQQIGEPRIRPQRIENRVRFYESVT